MFKRVLTILCVTLLLTLALQSCNPQLNYYTSMQATDVGGKPYLITGSWRSTSDEWDFSIYRVKDKNPLEWESVAPERLGVPYGAYVCKLAKKGQPGQDDAERLGIFHVGGTTLFDFSQKAVQTTYHKLPDKWIAETTAELNGTTYAFGATVGDDAPEANDKSDKNTERILRAAKWNGEEWEELTLGGPLVRTRSFSLQAVRVGNAIKILWRRYELDQPTGFEGPHQYSTEGPIEIASFDDKGFASETVEVPNLPRGNTSIWADGQDIKVLLQTRAKQENSVFTNSPMEIWTIQADGKAELSERIEGSQAKTGLLSSITAEHFVCDGREYILRSNSQTFQLWQKTPPGADGPAGWNLVSTNPKGLAVYDLQSLLVGVLSVAAAMIIFGVVLAFRRRKQAWALMHRIQAHEIYADLGLRIGAYVLDVALIIAAAMLLGKTQVLRAVSPLKLISADLNEVPYLPYLAMYMIYFCGSEWLAGATVGKYLMGLRVVMDGGRPLSLWAALVRNVVGFVERVPYLVPFVAMTMILFSPRRQRLGDILSRSFVVHKGAMEAYKAQREEDLAKQQAVESAAGISAAPSAEKNPQDTSPESKPANESKDKGPQA
jgi:uncharacterized RDD family membrane protein YckC